MGCDFTEPEYRAITTLLYSGSVKLHPFLWQLHGYAMVYLLAVAPLSSSLVILLSPPPPPLLLYGGDGMGISPKLV